MLPSYYITCTDAPLRLDSTLDEHAAWRMSLSRIAIFSQRIRATGKLTPETYCGWRYFRRMKIMKITKARCEAEPGSCLRGLHPTIVTCGLSLFGMST